MRELVFEVEGRRLVSMTIALTFCLSAILGLLVASPMHSIEIAVQEGPVSDSATLVRALALTVHDPIIINGDENFTVENGVTQGSGTLEDPYVIEGWDIDVSLANGIEISNTRAFFVSRNVSIQAVQPPAHMGVFLWNVTNATIEGLAMVSAGGVTGSSCSDIVIRDNDFGITGIYMYESRGIRVESNRLTSSGIGLSYCSDAAIADNTVLNCSVGISVYDCNRVSIMRNSVSNLVTESHVLSIDVDESSNVSVYHNNFMKAYQAYDPDGVDWNGDNNTWDDGYPSGGNYWSSFSVVDTRSGPNQDQPRSDGIGDRPKYLTSQTAGFPGSPADHYPLMKPWTLSWKLGEDENPHTGEGQVGVKAGDWIEFDYKISGAPYGTTLPTWLKIEFLSVEGTNATVRATMQMSDGTEQNATVPVDIFSGGEALGLSGLVIPANLTTGNSISMSGYGNVTISGETTRKYAGASRTVVYAGISQYGTEGTYYWDKETGVLVEADGVSGGMTITAKATETNLWEAQSSGFLTNSTVLFALAIVAVVIVVAMALLVMRRRKRPDWTVEQEEPPTAPPST